jgi:hypothetical protein
VVGKWLRLIDAVELAKYVADSGPDLLAGAIRAHGRLLIPQEYNVRNAVSFQTQGRPAAIVRLRWSETRTVLNRI